MTDTMSSFAQTLDRFYHTLRHLKPAQFYHRLRRMARPYQLDADDYPRPDSEPASALVSLESPLALEAEAVPARADDLVEGRFEFVGRPPVVMDSIDWQWAPEDDELWRFNLHYFEWALDLARAWRASGETQYAQRALDAIDDWIASNPFPQGSGWHPYPTSRRLVAWSKLLAALQEAPGWSEVAPEAFTSIEQQVDYLADWPEYDLEGNHLLANLHALAWTSIHLGNRLSPRVRRKLVPFVEQFWHEWIRQTKLDGSHEENAFSYQLLVLKDAFELFVSAPERASECGDIETRLEAMFQFVATLIRPEGTGPMVNDTVPGYPMEARPLLAAGASWFERDDWAYLCGDVDLEYVRWTLGASGVEQYRALEPAPSEHTSFCHADSGYAVMREGWAPDDDYTLVDAGPIGPDHIPGHAHADTLQVLLSAKGLPLLVDPGVYTYDAGEARDWFRSTPAHNTVSVDDRNQSEVWDAFRVARRARAAIEEWSPGRSITASHDGYERLDAPVRHRRAVHYEGESCWRIDDELITKGRQSHTYRLHFQLAEHYTLETLEATEVTWTASPSSRASPSSSSRVANGGSQTPHSNASSSMPSPSAPEAMLEAHFECMGPPELSLHVEYGPVSRGWRRARSAPRLVATLQTSGRVTTLETYIQVRRRDR